MWGLDLHPAREARRGKMQFTSPKAAKNKGNEAFPACGIAGSWTPEAAQPGPFVAIKKWPFVAIKKILENPASEPKTIRRYKRNSWGFGGLGPFLGTLSCNPFLLLLSASASRKVYLPPTPLD